jgi:hypothetical protein
MEVQTHPLPNGRKGEEYRLNGQLHNPNGPARREWNEAGVLICEEYYLNDRRHNPNGPAYRTWNEAGILLCEAYWLNGRWHNPLGPAILCYGDAGALTRKHYCLNGAFFWEDHWRDQTKPPEILAIISILHRPVASAIIQHYCRA